jgi:hypothetical protein
MSRAATLALPLLVCGCGNWWEMKNPEEHPVLVTPPQGAAIPPPPGAQSGPVGPGAPGVPDMESPRAHLAPIPPHNKPPTSPPPPHLIHPPAAPLEAPTKLPASEAAIPVNIVGSWQDDRGADLTFTDDGRFEIDAASPHGGKIRALGTYVLADGKATMTYVGIDIDSSDPNIVANEMKIKDEFMKKGPGAAPQVQAIEMKSKDSFVMRLQNAGANRTVAVLTRKA